MRERQISEPWQQAKVKDIDTLEGKTLRTMCEGLVETELRSINYVCQEDRRKGPPVKGWITAHKNLAEKQGF